MPLVAGRLRGPDGVRGALWRSQAVFRLVAVLYALVTVGRDLGRTEHPPHGYGWFAAVIVWSAVMSLAAPAADRRRSRLRNVLVIADVVVCLGVLLTSGAVSPPGSRDVLPALWTASGVFSAASVGGAAGGAAAGAALSVGSVIAAGAMSQVSLRPTVLFVVSGAVVGYLSRAALRSEAALAQVLAARAGDAERERLARGVHDSVLQVLALIAREAPRGMPPAEVARLAAEQEMALRDLLRAPRLPRLPRHPVPASRGHPLATAGAPPAEVDLATLLTGLGRREQVSAAVTVSTPGVPVMLAAERAGEIAAAVRAVLDNVAAHAGAGASAWLLLEEDGDAVTVTVRDDGVGLEPGRVERAEAEGRLGLAVSVRGRIRDLGGDVAVTGRPGEGTEVELRVPR